jgi:hypothetical protein
MWSIVLQKRIDSSLYQSKSPPRSWNPKVHYPVYNSLPLGPVLGPVNPVWSPKFYFQNIHFNIISSPRLDIQVVSSFQSFNPESYTHDHLPHELSHSNK